MTDSRVTALDDEELIGAVRRSLLELVLPRLQETGADEFLVAELKSCLSMLDFTGRGLAVRQAARVVADEQIKTYFKERPEGSAWRGIDHNSTGAFLALARRPSSGLSGEDQALATRVRELLRGRLQTEIRTRVEGR